MDFYKKYTLDDILLRDYKQKFSGKMMLALSINWFLIAAISFSFMGIIGNIVYYIAGGISLIGVIQILLSIKRSSKDAATRMLELKILESGYEADCKTMNINKRTSRSPDGDYTYYQLIYSFKDSNGFEQTRLCRENIYNEKKLESLKNTEAIKVVCSIEDDIYLLVKDRSKF